VTSQVVSQGVPIGMGLNSWLGRPCNNILARCSVLCEYVYLNKRYNGLLYGLSLSTPDPRRIGTRCHSGSRVPLAVSRSWYPQDSRVKYLGWVFLFSRRRRFLFSRRGISRYYACRENWMRIDNFDNASQNCQSQEGLIAHSHSGGKREPWFTKTMMPEPARS
jgi:hypothetical protein